MEKETLELLLSQGVSVERIAKRFGKDPSTVSYWMKKYGLESPHARKHAAKGGIERVWLAELADAGMTVAEISRTVGLSATAVRHWLKRYGLRTKNRVGPRTGGVSRAARDAGRLTITLECLHHGKTEFSLEGRGYYRCKRCRVERVTRHRRQLKATLVAEAGGKCVLCGYDRNPRALEFHHLDPRQKRLCLSARGVTLSLDTLRAEASKCVLLCANCHAEVEAGAVSVPLEFPP